MPESRYKYLYERLGDHDFQLLVNALLTERFTDYVPLPLRQPDGGRDGIQTAPANRLVYQVKWSVRGRERDPVSWLDATVTKEKDNITRLAAEGVRKYVIVTNVPSTGKLGTGTFDRLNKKLAAHSEEYGLEITGLWREAIDGMVDNADSEIKWQYADMLAGWDLIRYLLSEQAVAQRDSGLGDLVRRVAAAQWKDDERIKFSQVELDREHLSDLFVDVPADRIQVPRRAQTLAGAATRLGGAATYVTERSPYPFTLVRGAPGQGKSTLSQYVCQTHRAAFMPEGTPTTSLPYIKDPRFPVRADLADYAAWLQGFDVFDTSESAKVKKGTKRAGTQASIEHFLADLMTHLGGSPITPSDVQDLFDRVPSLVVLDGLDEVGGTSARGRIVREIDLFCSRGTSYAVEPRVIVTSRPNSAGLPEPDRDVFEIISLGPLEPALRDEYLRKWCLVHNVPINDSRTLRRNFNEKTREPYIGELAGNPMQLTILLFLLRQHGDATPSQRTELYDAYMSMLLARESNKHPDSVRKYRSELMEVVPFLGWYIQSRAEEQGHSGRMTYAEVEAAMKHFQRTYGKPESVVDDLFLAASDRLWALTSKEEGTFEFEVLSLREYFAARYLYTYAGEGDQHFDRTLVLRELLRRPYWLNTTRFYGGNAAGADIYALQAGIMHELAANTTKQVRVAAWSLITDGVFNSRPIEAAQIVDALTGDLSGPLLLAALDGKEITALPETSHASSAWDRITKTIAGNPDDPGNPSRVRILRELLGQPKQFADWWTEQLTKLIGTPHEIAWLTIGARCEALAGETRTIPRLSAEDGERAQLILNTGITPPEGSTLEAQLLRAVLDGQCSETTSVRSVPAQIAVALTPAAFYSFGVDSATPQPNAASPDRRSQAMQQLRKSNSPYVPIAALRRFRQGEKGSTFPWSNTATALLERVGRCWLVSEIAIIGAASPLRNGYKLKTGMEALGSDGHPAALIAQTRANRANSAWWAMRLTACDDDLARAEWALALWAVADAQVINELDTRIVEVVGQLPDGLRRACRIAARRLAQAGFLAHGPVSTSPDDPLHDWVGRPDGEDEIILQQAKAATRDTQPEPLAVVARRKKWLKVDQTATYH
ncbi:NACHT domain-containing protein [Humibacter ginsenosidimutans]|uniref:Large ATP-binding protein n=1 Tax=Humibacter ginsenosidimutans TaxID=2599293 RepID=A0A5B8M3K1_9MICO|nr:large ATP-binding protein [Humibacter ginsenosidimutans]QDZ14170.1 large ATP-binding protein [Humibacter ginsenosidimutans]